jgi:hypothetical protein
MQRLSLMLVAACSAPVTSPAVDVGGTACLRVLAASCSTDEQKGNSSFPRIMKEILPAFDAMPDVIPRYAWFVARGAENTNDVLITNDGLNALGRYYNDSS